MHVYSHVVIAGRKYRQTPSGVNDYHNITLTMIFSNCTIRENIHIKINNCVIDRVHVTRFLGVLIDEKLN